MTTATFKHIDTESYQGKAWVKVDGPGQNFKLQDVERAVHNAADSSEALTVDNAGFQFIRHPAKEKLFTDDSAVRHGYYAEVEDALRSKISGIKKVHIFDHTIRRRQKDAPRQPVQQVHVDQTPAAAEARVRRHLPAEEAEELLKGRFQIINVWRPIENPASDFPLAVVDWRSTSPKDFVAVDLMYPKRPDSVMDDDDRGKEKVPSEDSYFSTEGYEVRGETMSVAPSTNHKFYYMKDMSPDDVLFLKCYDSFGEGRPQGIPGLALRTPHTAFVDPNTPADAPGRQSIEVRCLVFYD